jgi:DNA-binding transcriptional MocR family regulator
MVKLSLGVPSGDLLPISKMNKALMAATRSLNGSGTSYDTLEGNTRLRSMIARRSFQWGGQLSGDDIIVTSGCINAIAYSLMATTKPGDTIAVESPAYFGLLQLAKSLGLQVIELPANRETGVELDALTKLVITGKINACLFVPNFSNPLGSCMPDESKAALVSLLENYSVPLIEDDLYGDLYFDQRPRTCKSFDKSGNVLWCSSVSKTLAPGYRVGWVAPGRYIDAVKKMKLFHVMANTSITQEAVALFWEANRYDKHLQKIRDVLRSNSTRFVNAINEYFPKGSKVAKPSGGLVLWVELPHGANAIELYERALLSKISLAPGRMFTLKDQYSNCFRLNYALKWDKKVDDVLRTVGALAHQ